MSITLDPGLYWRLKAAALACELAELKATAVVGQARAERARVFAEVGAACPEFNPDDAAYTSDDATCTLTKTGQ